MSVQEQIEGLRVQRAAEWYELMTTGEAREADRREFQAWLAESPLNNRALLKLTALSHELRGALAEHGANREALLDQLRSHIIPFTAKPGNDGPYRASRRVGRQWRQLLAAAVVLSLAAGWLWMSGIGRSGEQFQTSAGEQRTINLGDGSVVYLNAQSQLWVALNRDSREVRLDGEALFQVAPDAHRAFEVRTADAAVRAVGTAFNVASGRHGTHVAVIEGKVQVSRGANMRDLLRFNPQPAVQRTALAAGEAARVSRDGTIERRPTQEAADAIAWREHRVVIDGMGLEEAVEQFNKYQRTLKLRVENVPSGAHHYSGTFDALDPQAFVDFLAHEPDLMIERRGTEIVIRGRKNP